MFDFKFYDIEQNSDEWDLLRCTRLTSSSMSKIMATPPGTATNNKAIESMIKRWVSKDAINDVKTKDPKKSLAFTDQAKKMAVKIAIGRITGTPSVNEGFSNGHTDRGHEQEPIARKLYEDMFFCETSNGGFFGSDFLGCSTDSLVDEGGVVEIKSVISDVHYANVKRQAIDPSYKYQFFCNLMFTGREWLDFVSYCADYPIDKQLYVCRIYAVDLKDEFKAIRSRIEMFSDLVNKTIEDIESANYIIGV